MTYPDYETIEIQFSWGMLTEEDMEFYTDNGFITKDEYKKITGEDYPKA